MLSGNYAPRYLETQSNVHSWPPRSPLRRNPVYPSLQSTTQDPANPLSSKERTRPGEISRMTLTGEVRGKTAILIDDMADTCGTLCTAAEVLAQHGTTQVISVVTHGILSGDAIKKLNACDTLSKVVVTNTVPLLGKDKECDKIRIIDISPTLAGKSD